MGFGPTGDGNKKFAEMSEAEKQQYREKRDDLLSRLSDGATEPADLKKLLDEACDYGMLYHPDGREVTKQEVENMTLVKKGMADEVSKLIVASHDPLDNSTLYHPMTVMDDTITMDWYKHLSDLELLEKKQEFILANRGEKRAAALYASEYARNPLNREGFDKFFENMNTVMSELTKENTELGSRRLQNMIEIAIESRIVHFSDGTLPKKEDVAEIAKAPAYLKDLVFDNYNENSYTTYRENLRLKLSDDEPPKVQLDYMHPLTAMDVAKMEQKRASYHKKEELPGLLAKAMKVTAIGEDNGKEYEYEKVDYDVAHAYLEEMVDLGMELERIEDMDAFRMKPGNELYVFGRSTPVTSLDELAKEIEGAEPPKEPNAWGIFEFLRKGWHGIFHNVADYVEYENQSKEYEVTKYNLGKQAGFDVSDKDEMIARYEEELVGYRDGLVDKQVQVKPESQAEFDKDLAKALRVVSDCLDEKQPSDFYRSIEAVLRENTELGSIMRKGFANMEHDNLNGFYRQNELLLAKKQFEADKDSPALKRYGKYAAVYTCGFQRAFTGKVFKNKELNFDREVNLLVTNACNAVSKLSKANPNMAPDKLQAKIAAEMQKKVDTFKDLAKDAVKDNLDTFEEDLYIAERASASFEEQNVGKVTDVAKAQAATQKIMEGEAVKYAAANPQNNVTQVQNNAPEVQENVNEAQNDAPQPGAGI